MEKKELKNCVLGLRKLRNKGTTSSPTCPAQTGSLRKQDQSPLHFDIKMSFISLPLF